MDRASTARRRIRRSLSGIRLRVVVAYFVLLLAALAIANVVVRQVLLTRLDRDIEAALTQEVEELRQLASGIDPATGQPFGDDVASLFDTFLRRNVTSDGEAFYTVIGGEGFLTSFAPPAPLLSDPETLAEINAATEPLRFDVDSDAGEARLLAVPLSNDDGVLGTFVVAFFPADEQAEIGRAVTLVAVVSGVVLVIATGVAWSLAGTVLRPVAQLTDTATQITETDLSSRIPVTGDDELARLGTTVNLMLDRLERVVTVQRRFLNDIAHDLRTPLTIIHGHLDMLLDSEDDDPTPDPDERRATLTLVTEELDRMGRLVSELLVLAKAEQSDFLRLGLVDLGEWAADLHANAQSLADRAFVLDQAPQPGEAIAEADSERLIQAALNLIVNAVQHTGDGDEIRLAVVVDGPDATVSVIDDGPGIAPDLVSGLFERSSRGDRSRGTRRDGTGLGLAIVRAIAEAHGGSVSVASVSGHGSTFSFTIPLDPGGRITVDDGDPCQEF